MCGIAGYLAYAGVPADAEIAALGRMRMRMSARGPDGEGEWLSPDRRVGLAHRRLAIIDLDARANQPMVSADGTLVIVFNGEIYNHRELRRRLESGGCLFRTQSDTEVLLHLYRARGARMVDDLRGMFAFALWDGDERRLLLARDPLGIKPLYVADDGRTLRFASQVKALAAGGLVSGRPSEAGVVGFHLWGHVPEPWTWLDGVKALPAGTTLTLGPGYDAPRVHRFFDLAAEISAAESSPPPFADAVGRAAEAVRESVRRHLVADVPVGVFLSSGRDSSILAASVAAEPMPRPLRTVTLRFADLRDTPDDEAPCAERIATLLGAAHATVAVTQRDFEEERERLLDAMDQPTIDGVNTYFVSRAARQAGLKVALSGLGGDELFGGYPSFRQVPAASRRLRHLHAMPGVGRWFRELTSPVARRLGRPKWAGLLEYGTTVPGAYLLRRALFMPWELDAVLEPELVARGLEQLRPLDMLDEQTRGIRSPYLQVMALELTTYMRDQLLRDTDWASLALSLEVRVPFVDVELLRDWLPLATRALPAFDRQQLLRVMSPPIAAVLANRGKTGFNIPVERWLPRTTTQSGAEVGLRPWALEIARRFRARSAEQTGRHQESRAPRTTTGAPDGRGTVLQAGSRGSAARRRA